MTLIKRQERQSRNKSNSIIASCMLKNTKCNDTHSCSIHNLNAITSSKKEKKNLISVAACAM